MNTTLKNVLLTIVIALWLIIIGYSLSCFVAYLIGWPPFVAPLICTIISLLAIIVGLFLHKKKDITATFFVIFVSFLLSGLVNVIILGMKLKDNTYVGGVICTSNYHGYLYNKWGYKIFNVGGKISYEDSVIYLETNSHVYVFDYNGDLKTDDDFKEDFQYGRTSIFLSPYTRKYMVKIDSSIRYRDYDAYEYLGETDRLDFFKCQRNGLWDLIKVGKKSGHELKYRKAQSIQEFGYPLRCFVINDEGRYIISSVGSLIWIVKNGVVDPYWDESDYRLYYYDNDGKLWHCQLKK